MARDTSSRSFDSASMIVMAGRIFASVSLRMTGLGVNGVIDEAYEDGGSAWLAFLGTEIAHLRLMANC